MDPNYHYRPDNHGSQEDKNREYIYKKHRQKPFSRRQSAPYGRSNSRGYSNNPRESALQSSYSHNSRAEDDHLSFFGSSRYETLRSPKSDDFHDKTYASRSRKNQDSFYRYHSKSSPVYPHHYDDSEGDNRPSNNYRASSSNPPAGEPSRAQLDYSYIENESSVHWKMPKNSPSPDFTGPGVPKEGRSVSYISSPKVIHEADPLASTAAGLSAHEHKDIQSASPTQEHVLDESVSADQQVYCASDLQRSSISGDQQPRLNRSPPSQEQELQASPSKNDFFSKTASFSVEMLSEFKISSPEPIATLFDKSDHHVYEDPELVPIIVKSPSPSIQIDSPDMSPMPSKHHKPVKSKSLPLKKTKNRANSPFFATSIKMSSGGSSGDMGTEKLPLPIRKFTQIDNLSEFYESNRKFLQDALSTINEPRFPKPSILEDFENVKILPQTSISTQANPQIIAILENEKRLKYQKRCKAIHEYKRLYRAWKKKCLKNNSKDNPHLNLQPSSLSTRGRPVLLRSNMPQQRPQSVEPEYPSDSVRSEEELNRVLLSLLQYERSDPTQRWMFTLAKVPAMNSCDSEIHFSGSIPAALIGPVETWWINENQYDPRPVFTTNHVFSSISQCSDLHSRLLVFLSRTAGSQQEFSDTFTGFGGLRPFTEKEKTLFKEKYFSAPKKFDNILKVFPDRSLGDMIQYYYESKKTVNPPYKKWWASSKSASSYSSLPSLNVATAVTVANTNVKKKLSSSTTTSNVSVAAKGSQPPEKNKLARPNFSWLLKRPVLVPESDHPVKNKIAYWTPMERIVLVNGMIKHGLSLSKLSQLLSSYRQQVSLSSELPSLKRRSSQTDTTTPNHELELTPTKSLLMAMNRCILEPPPSSHVILMNSEDEVKLFYDIYAETYALKRFVATESLALLKPSNTGRKHSLPISLTSFSNPVSVTIQAAHAAHVKLAAPIPSRKFSLCINNLHHPSRAWTADLRSLAHSPPLSSRLAEGSPLLSTGSHCYTNVRPLTEQIPFNNSNHQNGSFSSDTSLGNPLDTSLNSTSSIAPEDASAASHSDPTSADAEELDKEKHLQNTHPKHDEEPMR